MIEWHDQYILLKKGVTARLTSSVIPYSIRRAPIACEDCSMT